MYHIGKVLKVIGCAPKEAVGADNSFQVHLDMWDGNQIIVLVHPALQNQVKADDFVLVRYGQPEPTVWKILRPKEGKEIWDSLAGYLSQKNFSAQNKNQNFGNQDQGFGKMIG